MFMMMHYQLSRKRPDVTDGDAAIEQSAEARPPRLAAGRVWSATDNSGGIRLFLLLLRALRSAHQMVMDRWCSLFATVFREPAADVGCPRNCLYTGLCGAVIMGEDCAFDVAAEV